MTRILNRLNILQKLLLLSASFLLPIVVLAYYMVAGLQATVRFTDKEIFGARYVAALETLMDQVAHHPDLRETTGANGDWAKRTAESWKALESIDQQKPRALGWVTQTATGQQVAELSLEPLKAVWGNAKLEAGAAERGGTAAPVAEVLGSIEGTVAAVGDATNLSLDPQLDTDSLIKMAMLTLPGLQSRLAALLANSQLRDTSRKLTVEEQAQLLLWASLLKEEGAEVAQGAARALATNARLHGTQGSLQSTLPTAVQAFTIDLETLVLFLAEMAKPESPPEQRQALVQFATSVSDAGFTVWRTALEELEKLLANRRADLVRRSLTAILATLAALAISAGLIVLIIRNITKPLHLLVTSAKRIATGDLTGTPDLARRDEIGTLGGALSAMTQSLAGLVGKVQGASVQMASTATELAASSRQQEMLVSDLGGSTAKVAVAVNQISATSAELAEAMQRVEGVAGTTSQLAAAGRTGLAEMEGMMRHLLQATAAVSSGLGTIREQADTVSAVITTMAKVADQTNLLSLNAAIEAERLGEQGHGFAVVAKEIRRLADQAAVATLDIEHMVQAMRAAVSAGGREVEAFSATMEGGAQASVEVNRQLDEIITRITELTPQFEAVTAGVQAQSVGARQISDAVTHLNQSVKQSTESVHHLNDAASHMREAAQNLRTEVEGFRV